MKIYIDGKKCTGCGKCKAACSKGPRIYSIEDKNGKKSLFCRALHTFLVAGCA